MLDDHAIEEFQNFRLDKALKEAMDDVKYGRYSKDLDAHLREIDSV